MALAVVNNNLLVVVAPDLTVIDAVPTGGTLAVVCGTAFFVVNLESG